MKYIPPINGDTGNPDRSYINANPAIGLEGSVPPAASWEHPQREIINAILAAGLVPDENDLTQLAAAIALLAPANGFDSIATITATAYWNKPVGITKLLSLIVGAGAGGAGAKSVNNSNECSGGGGGTGGWSLALIDVTSVSSVLATIGIKGTGGLGDITYGRDGNDGGSSSFGPYHSATGGLGGKHPPSLVVATGRGGAAGVGSGGVLNITGNCGHAGGASNPDETVGGEGGGSIFGGGGLPGLTASNVNTYAPTAGQSPGAGGGGASDGTAAGQNGADGHDGIWVGFLFK